MPKTRNPSPARSQGALLTPRRNRPRRSRSVSSPAQSNASGRLTALIKFTENNMDSLVLSPINSRLSVLTDDTEVEEPKRKSWWKKLDENSRDVLEVLEHNDVAEPNNILDELDMEVLSQEKKNYTLDLPDSSESESICSIVIPQRKLFTQKENLPQKKFCQLVGTRESMAKINKTNVLSQDKTLKGDIKTFFGHGAKRSKPIFPAGLLNISSKSTADKTKEMLLEEPKNQVRNIFGNRPVTKRNNMFADFVASESEDEISEIQPKLFGFHKNVETRISSTSRDVRRPSLTANITTDTEMDEWIMLPSSTMVENQLDELAAGLTPVKKARLSKLSETRGSKIGTNNETDIKPKHVLHKSSDKLRRPSYFAETKQFDVEIHEDEANINQEQIIDEKESDGDEKNLTLTYDDENIPNHSEENENAGDEPMKDIDIDNNKTLTLEGEARDPEINEGIEDHNEMETNKHIEIENNKTLTQKADACNLEINKEIEDHNEMEMEDMNEEKIEADNQDPDNFEACVEHNFEDKIEEDEQNQSGHKGLTDLEKSGLKKRNKSVTQNNENEIDGKQVDEHEGIREQDDEQGDDDDNNQEDDQLEQNVQVELDQQDENDSDREEQNDSEVEQNVSHVEVSNEQNDSEEKHNESHVEVSNEQNDVQVEEQNDSEDENQEEQNRSQEVGNEQNYSHVEEEQNDPEGENEVEQNESHLDVSKEQNYSQLEKQNQSEDEQNESHAELNNEQNDSQDEEQNDSEGENEVDQNESHLDESYAQNESHVEEQNDSEDENEQNESHVEDNNEQNDSQDEELNGSEGENEVEQNESHFDISNEQNDSSLEKSQSDEQNDDDAEEEQEMEVDDDNVEEMENDSDEAYDKYKRESVEHNKSLQATADTEEFADTPNTTHDTTGRYRKKNQTQVRSPEAVLDNRANQADSFTAQGRNTSIRKTKSMRNVSPSLVTIRESVGISDGTKDSSAEGSGWDSHRTTRKTLRQTLGKDFTLRKSLRALVMEKSAKRHTEFNVELTDVTKPPQANSTEFHDSCRDVEGLVQESATVEESDHEASRMKRQTTLELYLQKVKRRNVEDKINMEEAVKKKLQASLQAARQNHIFKVPARPPPRKPTKPNPQAQSKTTKSRQIKLDRLPAEILEDLNNYKPPKRFRPSNASWITKRLYKFLETKLEPRYDYKARVRAEKLAETLYNFTKDLRRHEVAPTDAVQVLKQEMARLDIVRTHFDFYEFFHDFMPREIRTKVVPDLINKIPLPKHGVFTDIM